MDWEVHLFGSDLNPPASAHGSAAQIGQDFAAEAHRLGNLVPLTIHERPHSLASLASLAHAPHTPNDLGSRLLWGGLAGACRFKARRFLVVSQSETTFPDVAKAQRILIGVPKIANWSTQDSPNLSEELDEEPHGWKKLTLRNWTCRQFRRKGIKPRLSFCTISFMTLAQNSPTAISTESSPSQIQQFFELQSKFKCVKYPHPQDIHNHSFGIS